METKTSRIARPTHTQVHFDKMKQQEKTPTPPQDPRTLTAAEQQQRFELVKNLMNCAAISALTIHSLTSAVTEADKLVNFADQIILRLRTTTPR